MHLYSRESIYVGVCLFCAFCFWFLVKLQEGITMKKAIIALSMLAGFVYGCATPVAELKPTMPAKDIYVDLDCKQLEEVCSEKTNEIRLFAARQETKQSKDSTKMVANVLLMPVFWGVGNDENTAKLQDAMGCYREASDKAESLKCDFKRLPIKEILNDYK
jgi:hypothetical protein